MLEIPILVLPLKALLVLIVKKVLLELLDLKVFKVSQVKLVLQAQLVLTVYLLTSKMASGSLETLTLMLMLKALLVQKVLMV